MGKKIIWKMNELLYRHDSRFFSEEENPGCSTVRRILPCRNSCWYSSLLISLEIRQRLYMPLFWWETLKYSWTDTSCCNGAYHILINLIGANSLHLPRNSWKNMWSDIPANVWSGQRRENIWHYHSSIISQKPIPSHTGEQWEDGTCTSAVSIKNLNQWSDLVE